MEVLKAKERAVSFYHVLFVSSKISCMCVHCSDNNERVTRRIKEG